MLRPLWHPAPKVTASRTTPCTHITNPLPSFIHHPSIFLFIHMLEQPLLYPSNQSPTHQPFQPPINPSKYPFDSPIHILSTCPSLQHSSKYLFIHTTKQAPNHPCVHPSTRAPIHLFIKSMFLCSFHMRTEVCLSGSLLFLHGPALNLRGPQQCTCNVYNHLFHLNIYFPL